MKPKDLVESLLNDEIPSLKGKGIEVTRLPDGPNGQRRFQVAQQSAGGREDDHWIANQISWHYGAKNQFTVGDRKGNSFVVHIPKAESSPAQRFSDFAVWKQNAASQGLKVRTGTHPNGNVNSYSTAKDAEGNERGHFDHETRKGQLDR